MPVLYGSQVNLLAGLTRRLLPNFLVGAIGGYETFGYRSDALQGRSKGDGWTVGSYLGWKITQSIRFDAAVAYSGIGYDGTAAPPLVRLPAAAGWSPAVLPAPIRIMDCKSNRQPASTPCEDGKMATPTRSARCRPNATFSTGPASGGVKVAYPVAWTSTVALRPPCRSDQRVVIPPVFARGGHGRTRRADPAGRSEHAAQAAARNEPK